jgi:hypothetical protein
MRAADRSGASIALVAGTATSRRAPIGVKNLATGEQVDVAADAFSPKCFRASASPSRLRTTALSSSSTCRATVERVAALEDVCTAGRHRNEFR